MVHDRTADQEQHHEADRPHESALRHDDLDDRLERLPVGHPSSPYRDDGSRKPPPQDLAEYELLLPDEQENAEPGLDAPTEPLTDAEYAEHVGNVRECLIQARTDGLATDELYTDPSTHGEIWSRERQECHDAIVDELYDRAADVPNEHQAIIAGGLPGAGKSTILQEYAGIDTSQFLRIDPDNIKLELALRGLIPQVEGLSPMEASDLVHEESSFVAKALAQRAQADGKNVIWDITMSSRSSVEERIDVLRAAGYTRIEGLFVDIPIETSEARAAARHRSDHENYRAGKGEGGRLVPQEVTHAKADPGWGSVNRRVFEEVKHRFDAWSVYDNSVDGSPPTLIDSGNVRRPHGR